MNFIREVYYLDWLANMVMVKKASGKWRMCVDFTNLNKACPKDSYPLLRVYVLVDFTAQHQLLSFMDTFRVITRSEWTKQIRRRLHSSLAKTSSAIK